MALPHYSGNLPIDLRRRVGGYTRSHDIDEFWTRNAAAVSACAQTALDDSGSEHGDIATWVLPNFGNVLLRKQCLEPLKIPPEQTLFRYGREIGHTGAADPFVGLDLVRRNHDLEAGDRLMLIGIGVGFTWGCAVVEYTGTDADEGNERR